MNRRVPRGRTFFRGGLAAGLALAAGAAGARAETVFPLNVDPAAGVSIRLSTPLTAAPRFGFLPLRVFIENSTDRDEVWQLEFRSGRVDGFPGEIRSRIEVNAPARSNRDTWVYVNVSEQGVVTNPSATTVATTAARAPTPAPPPAAASPVRSFFGNLGAAGFGASRATELPPPTAAEKQAAQSAAEAYAIARQRYFAGQITEDEQFQAQVASVRAAARLLTDPVKRAAAEAEAEGVNTARTQAELVRLQPRYLAGLVTAAELSKAQGAASAAALAEQKAKAAHQALVTGASSSPTALTAAGRPVPAVSQTAQVAEEAARRVLRPTGLLDRPGEIAQSVVSVPLDPANERGSRLVVFVQTGSAALLAAPAAGSLPDGVVANVHPTDTPGRVTRTLSYVPTAQWNARPGIVGGSTAPSPAHVRIELMRHGYGITRPGVWVTDGVTGSGSTVAATTVTETGPDAAVPMLGARKLPANIGVVVGPTGVPGESARTFFVGSLLSRAMITGLTVSTSFTVMPALPSLWTVGSPANKSVLRMTGAGLRGTQEVDLGTGLEAGILASPPLACSSALVSLLRSRFGIVSTRTPVSLAGIDFAAIPVDWRFWSSFHGLVLRSAEYEALDATQRAAIRTWVALGGQLFLFPEAAATGRRELLGAGTINWLELPLGDYGPAEIVPALQLSSLSLNLPGRDALTFGRTSPLRLFAIESAKLDHRWTVGFLIGFAVLAGPVNFLVFAPRGKRQRLFISTPAIAVFGVIAVAGSIVIQDGAGGGGQRSTVVAFLPDDNAAVVFQEQVARTGFLVSRRFPIDESILFGGVTLAGFGPAAPEYSLVRDGNQADGDWFRARWSQAHHARAFVPSRSRVDVIGRTPAGAPIVRSTLTTTLREFNYVDAADRIWEAAEIPTGRDVTLTSSEASLRPLIWTSGSRHLTNLLTATTQRAPGRWVAKGGSSDVAPIATLESMTWSNDEIWYTGLTDPGPPPPAETAAIQ